MSIPSLEKPLVTIVTVAYNSALYIRDTIESVLAQDYNNIEYIIGDDRSTDSTWAIINEYQDPRIIKYRNESNLGEYSNRNKAICMAKGEYLIFIDGDDIIYRHGLAVYMRYAIEFPQAALIIQKREKNNIIFPLIVSSKDLVINYYEGNNLITSSFGSNFFKTNVLKKHGLSEKFIQGDEYIRLKIAIHHPVLIIPGSLTWIRETPGQASSKLNSYKGLLDNINIFKELVEDIRCIGEAESLYIYKRQALRYQFDIFHYLKKLRFQSAIRGVIEFLRFFFISRKLKQPPSFLNFSKYCAKFPLKNPL